MGIRLPVLMMSWHMRQLVFEAAAAAAAAAARNAALFQNTGLPLGYQTEINVAGNSTPLHTPTHFIQNTIALYSFESRKKIVEKLSKYTNDKRTSSCCGVLCVSPLERKTYASADLLMFLLLC